MEACLRPYVSCCLINNNHQAEKPMVRDKLPCY